MNCKMYLGIINTFKKKEKVKRGCRILRKGDHR